MNDAQTTVVIAVALIVIMIIGVSFGIELSNREAVKTVCAEYNGTTGKFQWIKEYKR